MRLSLRTKVTAFVTAIVIIVSLVSTSYLILAHSRSIEREIIARGVTLAESLSRAVADGLAAENLEFIKKVSDIVHTSDVDLVQVYSSLWLPVDAYPFKQLNEPPGPAALSHFKTSEDSFYEYYGQWLEFYSAVFYKPLGEAESRNVVIGYVRLRLSTQQLKQSMREAINKSLLFSFVMTLIAFVSLNFFINKYVLGPLLTLHASVSKHIEGEFPESVPVNSGDEIGVLCSEFNRMSQALKEREKRLADERERLVVTLRSIGDAVIVTDVEGMITLINKIAEKQTGWAAHEAVGKHLSVVFNIINEKTRERCENPVDKVLKTGLITGLANPTALIRKDGTEIIIENSAAPITDRDSATIGMVLVFRDVTEKRRIEDELLKMEKLQSVGLLAGGIAHDFNNILTSVVGNISLAKMHIDAESIAYERLEKAEKASQRATDLSYRLLTFSKGGEPVRKSASIVDILKESSGFDLSGSHIASEFIISEDLCNVDVDAGQMSQVFSNLIINSVQAMPHGGKIAYSASNVLIEGNKIPGLEAGTYIHISVKDTGTGIPKEDIPRIFDPYFTTKPEGSGLGLASVYSIIKRHSGHITVESKHGKGTIFHIYLPVSGGNCVCKISEERCITAGHGKVLVMDDEKIVRDISGEMLKSLGYEVEFAINGAEAIEMYQRVLEAGRPFDVVIMDLTIPGGLGGKEAIQKLLSIDPEVKAIVSSGYSNDPIMGDFKHYGFRGVIIKPYTIEGFSRTLHEVMTA
jgi:PAS domain S-box-containing protein